MNCHLLYIDPGTGSALFSIIIGIVATLYFFSRTVIIKLKTYLMGSKSANSVSAANSYVIYNEGKHYCNVFLPILEEFEKREINILYLSSAIDDPFFNFPWRFVKMQYIGEGNRAYAYLNMLKAGICLMTTPGLDVYQLKRSKMTAHYSHVLHAPTDVTMYKLFGTDYFDSVLLTGDYQAYDIRTLERQRNIPEKKLVTAGCTYLDVYADKMKSLSIEDSHQFTVLVSPSWGASSLLVLYGEKLLDPLVKTGFKIIIRPHPQSKKSEPETLSRLESLYGDKLFWDYESENIISLSKADIMISDFSGIVYDYTFLTGKPVIYIMQGIDLRPYDADDLGKNAIENIWQFKTLKDIGVELTEDKFNNISVIIEYALKNKSSQKARDNAKATAWQFQGEAGKRIADFMIETVNTMGF